MNDNECYKTCYYKKNELNCSNCMTKEEAIMDAIINKERIIIQCGKNQHTSLKENKENKHN